METKFNFKSQICTDKNQSERLLTLGLKKETADMCWTIDERDNIVISSIDEAVEYIEPAWSLHGLLSLLPKEIPCEEENGLGMYLGKRYSISYFGVLGYYTHENLYDAVILCIEDVIKEGYFNKEYLV